MQKVDQKWAKNRVFLIYLQIYSFFFFFFFEFGR